MRENSTHDSRSDIGRVSTRVAAPRGVPIMYSNTRPIPTEVPRNLKLHADTPTTQNTVTAYGPGFVEINRVRHTTNLIVTPDRSSPGR